MATVSDYRPVLVERDGRFFLHIESLGLIAAGDDPDAAYAELKRRFAALEEDARAADLLDGLPPPPAVGAPARAPGAVVMKGDLKGFLIRVGIVLVAVLVVLLPVTWSVGGAVERAVAKVQIKGGRDFWANLEGGLHKMAGPEGALDPERRDRLLADLKVMVERVQPFAAALRPLTGEGPACPPPAKPH